MTVAGALAGGVVGTVVLTTGLRLAQEIGLTRMDIPLLLGTVFSDDRSRANIIGYALHFMNGLIFAGLYAAVFFAVGQAGWLFGAMLGLVHAVFAGGALVNILLPAVHPRMGTPWSDARETPILEPPGFMLRNYGRHTALATLIAHLAYGAIVGGFAAGL
ncbi:MAG: hypothetical protein ACRDKK_07735 [Gaiellaceae bacterium]